MWSLRSLGIKVIKLLKYGGKNRDNNKNIFIYFYYCPKKILPVGKSLMTLMTNDLNDHFFLRGW